MAIKVLLVEDEILVAEDIEADLLDAGFAVTGIAISAEECMQAFNTERPDVILMDINIKGGIDGIELANQILAIEKLPIIFLTANTDSKTIERASQTEAHTFISKPFNRKDLFVSIELAFQRYNQQTIETAPKVDGAIYVKKGEFHHRVLLNEIYFIEAAGSYCNIHTEKDSFLLSSNLNHFQTEVEHPMFVRTHRSFVVNVEKIEGFNQHSVLVNGKTIPISKSHRDEVLVRFRRV